MILLLLFQEVIKLMRLGEFNAALPWGLLLVTDDHSRDEISVWSSDDEQVTASATALVIRTINAAERVTCVRVWDQEGVNAGQLVFSGEIALPSGVLRVGDATADQYIKINFEAGQYEVKVFIDLPYEATQVDIVVGSSPDRRGEQQLYGRRVHTRSGDQRRSCGPRYPT